MKRIDLYSVRGQVMVLLFAVLEQLAWSATKRDVLERLSTNGWFAMAPEDLEPYPSKNETDKEPRWRTLVAFARKDAVEKDWLTEDERNWWEMSKAGREQWPSLRKDFESGKCDVSRCFMWTEEFKRHLKPGYVAQVTDVARPPSIYRDHHTLTIPLDALRYLE